MVEKFVSTVGVFAGILNHEGKVLLRRRVLPEEEKSLISGKTIKGDWELPGGIVEQKEMIAAGNEKGLVEVLKREVKEGLDLEINIPLPLEVFPVVLAKETLPGRFTNDVAMLIVVRPDQWKGVPKGEIMWADPKALEELTKKPTGEQLVSGWGKRMHRMVLIAISKGAGYYEVIETKKTLEKIYST